MKKILIFSFLLLVTLIVSGQQYNALYVVPDSSTAFGRAIPAKTLILQQNTRHMYFTTVYNDATKTLHNASGVKQVKVDSTIVYSGTAGNALLWQTKDTTWVKSYLALKINYTDTLTVSATRKWTAANYLGLHATADSAVLANHAWTSHYADSANLSDHTWTSHFADSSNVTALAWNSKLLQGEDTNDLRTITGNFTIKKGSIYMDADSGLFVNGLPFLRIKTSTENLYCGRNLSPMPNGDHNTSFGISNFSSNVIATNITSMGHSSLYSLRKGDANTSIGFDAGVSDTNSSYNTYVGAVSFMSNLTGSNSVGIGYSSGKYETRGNSFYVNTYNRLSLKHDTTQSLIYGRFDTDSSKQKLVVNGVLYAPQGMTGTASNSSALQGQDTTNNIATRKYVYNTAPVITVNAGDTTGSTPSKIGDIFVDTSGGKVYISKGVYRGGWLMLNVFWLALLIPYVRRKK